MLDLRNYTENDFPLVEAWWRQHHGNDFRPSYPPRASYIVTVDGIDAAFFGVAPMTPGFCYLSFPLINPELSKESRDKAIDFIIDAAKMWAVTANIPVLWYSGNGEKFLNRLGSKGFVTGESGCTHMFCKVGDIQ